MTTTSNAALLSGERGYKRTVAFVQRQPLSARGRSAALKSLKSKQIIRTVGQCKFAGDSILALG